MASHCSDSDTPLSVDEDAWMAYQTSATTTTSSTSSASTSTSTSSTSTQSQQPTTTTPAAVSTPSAHTDEPSGGLSSGAKAGIIIGSVVAGIAIVVLAVLWLRSRRKQQNARETHPMLLTDHDFFNDGTRTSAQQSHTSWAPSGFQSPHSTTTSPPLAGSWGRFSTGSQAPWSPGAFDSFKATPPSLGSSAYQPPPREDVYELPTETAMPSYPSPPSEMPTISVTSPTVSPTSRYSGADWGIEPPEPSRFEPFRPYRPE